MKGKYAPKEIRVAVLSANKSAIENLKVAQIMNVDVMRLFDDYASQNKDYYEAIEPFIAGVGGKYGTGYPTFQFSVKTCSAETIKSAIERAVRRVFDCVELSIKGRSCRNYIKMEFRLSNVPNTHGECDNGDEKVFAHILILTHKDCIKISVETLINPSGPELSNDCGGKITENRFCTEDSAEKKCVCCKILHLPRAFAKEIKEKIVSEFGSVGIGIISAPKFSLPTEKRYPENIHP